MADWTANDQARGNIARKWEIVELREACGVKPKQRENPTNYAHRVWLANKRIIEDDEIVPFQWAVRMLIQELEWDPEYQALLTGTASDELISRTLGQYYLGRKCGR